MVDFLRSGYETTCQFTSDDPPLISKIRWVRASPGAKHLGITTAFSSAVWDDKRELATYQVGEITGAVRRYWSAPLPGLLPGNHHEGSNESWRVGISNSILSLPTPLLTVDCQSSWVNCVWCPAGSAVKYQIVLDGITGSAGCVAFNGTYEVTSFTGCNWRSALFTPVAPFTNLWRIELNHSEFFTFVVLRRVNFPQIATWQIDRVASCNATRVIPFNSSIGMACGFAGSTATISTM